MGFVTVPIIRGFMEIRELYEKVTEFGGMICGGYVRYCASPRSDPIEATDVDVYCKDDSVFELLKNYFIGIGLEKRHENNMALTFKRPKQGQLKYCLPIQLIKPIREGAVVSNGTMEEIISNFDFSVIRIAIISPSSCLADEDFIKDEEKKMLRIKKIHCPISSTLRCMKYSRKGYWLRPFEVLKLFLDWENRTPEYRSKIIEYLEKAVSGKKDALTQEEIDHLEAMMRID